MQLKANILFIQYCSGHCLPSRFLNQIKSNQLEETLDLNCLMHFQGNDKIIDVTCTMADN